MIPDLLGTLNDYALSLSFRVMVPGPASPCIVGHISSLNSRQRAVSSVYPVLETLRILTEPPSMTIILSSSVFPFPRTSSLWNTLDVFRTHVQSSFENKTT